MSLKFVTFGVGMTAKDVNRQYVDSNKKSSNLAWLLLYLLYIV